MDKEYTKYLLEINEASANRNLSKNFISLDMITNSLAKLVNSLYVEKENIEEHHSELESKFLRYIIANHSIIKLLKGLNFKLIDKNINIVDIFSIKSIMRYQIESYLVMFYLFFDNVSNYELTIRYDIYKLHALNKQINFEMRGKYAKKKAVEIQKEINAIKQKIISTDKYLSSDDKTKNRLLNPNRAIMINRRKLFENSGLDKSRISDMWKIYSNYAHAEHISDRQFNSYYKLKTADLNSDCLLTLEINFILTSRMALMLNNQFNSCKKAFSDLTVKEKAHINLWGKLH